MYAVIAGGGKIGRFIAADLLDDGHDVAIIEPVAGRCDDLLREYDLLVIQGDATDVRDLGQTKPERADVFVATTHDDDANFVACQLALTAFDVPRVISRVNKPQNDELFKRLGIDGVSTTSLISRLIREQLAGGEVVHLATLRAGRLNLVEFTMPAEGRSRTAPVEEIRLPGGSSVVCVFRGDATLIASGETRLHAGDRVVAIARPGTEDELRAALTGTRSLQTAP